MTAAKKAYNKKVARETDGMSQEEKEHYLFVEKMIDRFENLVRELGIELFPEIYDRTGDSIRDSQMRQLGKNPMSPEYTEKVNERRKKLGFRPLGANGLPVDHGATIQYCEDLITGKIKYKPNCR